MRLPLAVAVLSIASLGCASAPRTAPRTTLDVALPGVSRGAAVARVTSALRAEGYQLAGASDAGGSGTSDGVAVFRTAPARHNPATTVVVLATVVTVVGADTASAGSRVTLSETYSTPSLRAFDVPVPESRTRLHGELWARLERLAAAVRGDGAQP